MSNRLSVWWDGRIAGTLYLGPDGETQFAYDPAWLADATAPALSFSLPKQAEPFNRRACQAFFGGILPEEGQRTAIARALGISADNEFRLLEYLGGEVAGALTLLPEGETPALPSDAAPQMLNDDTLAQLIADLPLRPMLAGVEATTAIRQAEVTAQRRMLDRARERFGLWPERLVADGGYGDGANLAWLVEEKGIEPHIPVVDHSARRDGTFERGDFTFDREGDRYICPGGKVLEPKHRNFTTPRPDVDQDGFIRYRASKIDCDVCALKPKCCPVTPMRKIMRSKHEGARDLARAIAMTDAYLVSHRERKKAEMLFAHLKRILKLDRLRLRGPYGAKDEFHLAAAAQNLRKLAKLMPIPVTAAS